MNGKTDEKEIRALPGWTPGNDFLFKMLSHPVLLRYKTLAGTVLANPAMAFQDKCKIAKECVDKGGEKASHPDPSVQELIDATDEEFDEMYKEIKRQSALWKNKPEADFMTLLLRELTGEKDSAEEQAEDDLFGDEIIFDRQKATDKNRSELPQLAKRINDLRSTLMETVIGQDHAVQAFADGIFNSELLIRADSGRCRPKAVFTFAGPPGVGKTFLSEQAAKLLGIPYKRFDMTEYSAKDAAEGLIGFDYTWKNAVPGKLTAFVQSNPRCVLLFDEIEKAHPVVLQLFYQLLDSGILTDKYYSSGKTAAEKGFIESKDTAKEFLSSDPVVPFKDTIIIFTSNVGRALYDGSSPMSAASVPRKMLLRAFETEIDPLTKEKFFPAALVSRIATGYPILFGHLRPRHLLGIIEDEFSRCSELYQKQYGIKPEADDNVFLALLFSEGGKSDARVLKTQTERFFKKEIFKLYSSGAADLDKCMSIRFETQTEGACERIENLFYGSDTPEILLYSNRFFAARCREKLTGCKLHIVRTPEEAVNAAMENDIRLALIDIAERNTPFDDRDTGERTVMVSSAASLWKDGRRILSALREKFPEFPMYILQSVYELGDELMLELSRAGARGKIREPEYDDFDSFEKELKDICRELYVQNMAETLAAEHKLLSFDTAFRKNDGEISIMLRGFELKASYDAEDAADLLDEAEKPDVRFDDIIGAASAKKELGFFADFLKNPKKYYAMGFRLPKGVLLHGRPGTGKTMLAKALAGETDVTFIPSKASAFVNEYQGSGPKAVRELFEKARRYAPSIIFIDEVDTIGKQRAGARGSLSEENTLNALLAEMDGFSVDPKRPVFVLAATNYDVNEGQGGIGVLDEAFMRRFDRKILIELPNREEREQLLKMKLDKIKNHKVTQEMIRSAAVRSMGMSPAVIDNVLETAKRASFDAGRELDDDLLDEALETVQFGEKKMWDKETLMRTARHEAGHAVINCLNGNIPSYITIEARGDFGGYMRFSEEQLESVTRTKNELLHRVRSSLGGRAAEICYYGQEEGLDTGASADLKAATSIVSDMITRYGMDSEFGIAAAKYTGSYSDKLSERVNSILKEEMQKTVQLIDENRPLLDSLVEALMEKNRLTRDEIEEITSRFTA